MGTPGHVEPISVIGVVPTIQEAGRDAIGGYYTLYLKVPKTCFQYCLQSELSLSKAISQWMDGQGRH